METARNCVGLSGAVGNTPLILLKKISSLVGRKVYGKAEYMSAGGSVKDRAALAMINGAEDEGKLVRGEEGWVVEATGGNTGISLALLCAERGYKCTLCMVETISKDKIETMKIFGAEVVLCPKVPFSNPEHYYQKAGSIATKLQQDGKRVLFTNQFENIHNANMHMKTTGPEILEQTQGNIDALVCAAGTGGTIGGLSAYLTSKKKDIKVVLADPMGSALYSYVKEGQWASEGSTLFGEGIGIDRLTANFAQAVVHDSVRCTDLESIAMCYYLLRHEGIFVGVSAALNVCAAVKVSRCLPEDSVVVTILCDGGDRYRQSAYNRDFLAAHGLDTQISLPPNLDFLGEYTPNDAVASKAGRVST